MLHLVTANANRRIDYLRQAGSEMFILTCAGCQTKRSFHESDLKPYTVSTLGYIKGYVERGALQRAAGPGLHAPQRRRLMADHSGKEDVVSLAKFGRL